MAQQPPPQYILPSQSLPLIPVRPTIPNNEATSQILNRRNSDGGSGSSVNGCSPVRRCSENNLSSHPTSSNSNNNTNEKPNATSSTLNNNNSKYDKQKNSNGENIMSRSNTPPPKSLLLDSSSSATSNRVSQIVNEALNKARSGEGNETEAAATNKAAPFSPVEVAAPTIIVSSRTISMTKDEFTSIILNPNETLVEESSSPAHINLGENNLNSNLGGENNLTNNNLVETNDDREIRIGNTGNPIGSLGYLWNSVATQKEMTVVVAADVSEKEGIDNSESE